MKVLKATEEALKQGTPKPNLLENDDPNASFHLGMELFGKETTAIEQSIQEKMTQIEQDLQEILDHANETTEETMDNIEQTPEELEHEAKQLKTKIAFLRECSKARSLLDESVSLSSPAMAPNEEPDLHHAAQHFVKANMSLEKAQKMVQAEEQKNPHAHGLGAAYKIIDSIRLSMRRQKVDLIGKAKTLWHASVVLNTHSLSVRCSEQNSGLLVAYDVLETFSKDGNTALEGTLRKFTKILFDDVFSPILESLKAGKPKLDWTFHETEDRAGASSIKLSSSLNLVKGPVRRLEWTREDDYVLGTSTKTSHPNTIVACKEIIEFIQRIVVFVSDRVLLGRPSLCQWVGKRLFGKPEALPIALNLDTLGIESCRLGDDTGLLMEPLVDAFMETCVPNYLKPDELDQLQSVSKDLDSFVGPFLQELAAKQLVADPGECRLTTFVSSFEQKYVDNRRRLILNEARLLLMNNDYHNTIQVGVDVHQDKERERLGLPDGMAVFKLHKSSISDTASKLMDLCRKTMDEAVEQQTAPKNSPLSLLPANLYRSARETLDLFRAIIPVTHGNEIKNVPRTAAVFHNDGVFFAHHCLTLGLEYKEKFPPPEPADARGNLLRQYCIFVDMVPLFRELADRSMRDMLQLQANQIAELVQSRTTLLAEALRSDEIVQEWSDAEVALEAGVYHMRHLLQAWKPVLSSDVFNRSMCYLADVIFTLYLDQVTKATDVSESASHFVSSLFQTAAKQIEELVEGDMSGSRVWDRFSAIGRFMDMSLADIEIALSDGVFRSVTGQELTRLIKATFDDSPKRHHLLKILASNK